MAGLSDACFEEITRLLVTRESISPAAARGAASWISLRVQAYFDTPEPFNSPRGNAFRAWVPGALRKLQEFEAWLRLGPDGSPDEDWLEGDADALDRIRVERHQLAKQVESFRISVWWAHDPRKPRGRPVDWRRGDLEEHVGMAMFLAGATPTKAEAGTYALVLEQVHATIGLPPRSAHKAVRQAIDNHREWRRPEAVPKFKRPFG